MKFVDRYTKAFQYLLPNPFTIAILLSIVSFIIALFTTKTDAVGYVAYSLNLLDFWEKGLWDGGLLVFAVQMMLMLVLGHILALTPLANKLIEKLLSFCTTTQKAAFVVTLFTILIALFNWGLGLIFGAIFARKVGEFAKRRSIPLNYPLIGAAGYSGLMVWHGGISGSSLTKIAEEGHLISMVSDSASQRLLAQLPNSIPFSETVFSSMNLVCILALLLLLPTLMYFVGKKSAPSSLPNFSNLENQQVKLKPVGAERLDYSSLFSKLIGGVFLVYVLYTAFDHPSSGFGFITPNFINLSLLGLGIFLHKNITSFLIGLEDAIGGAAGILIQFPLYFGIMGIMKESGLISSLSSFFVSISTPETFPIYTFFSAGLVNIFVPSGGGQWAIQGPIIIEASQAIGVSLPKCVMALAYGDQLTNMLQPFWALPLLGITGLKAKEILPYTLLMMLLGGLIYLGILLIF